MSDYLSTDPNFGLDSSGDNEYLSTDPDFGLSTDAKKPDEDGNITRGFKNTFRQLPQLAYGVEAALGATGENLLGEGGISSGIKKHGLENYRAESKALEEHSQPTDSLTYSWDRAKQGDLGALADWMGYGIGYAGGQGLQMLATAGLGSVAAKAGAKVAAQQLTEKMVATEASKLAGIEAAKVASGELTADMIQQMAVRNVAERIGGMGATAAIGANAFGMEGGEIGGGLVDKADTEGRKLTGDDLARAFGATVAAGSMEFLGDKLGLDILTGKSSLVKGLAGKKDIGSRLARGGIAGIGAAPAEGLTEYGQTLAEEWGKGNDPFSDENRKQAIDAAGLGALGGAVMGGVGGAINTPPAKDVAPQPSAEQVNQQPFTGQDQPIDLATPEAAPVMPAAQPAAATGTSPISQDEIFGRLSEIEIQAEQRDLTPEEKTEYATLAQQIIDDQATTEAQFPEQQTEQAGGVQPAEGIVSPEISGTGQQDPASSPLAPTGEPNGLQETGQTPAQEVSFVPTHTLSDGTPVRFNQEENAFETQDGSLFDPDGYEKPLENIDANNPTGSSTEVDQRADSGNPLVETASVGTGSSNQPGISGVNAGGTGGNAGPVPAQTDQPGNPIDRGTLDETQTGGTATGNSQGIIAGERGSVEQGAISPTGEQATAGDGGIHQDQPIAGENKLSKDFIPAGTVFDYVIGDGANQKTRRFLFNKDIDLSKYGRDSWVEDEVFIGNGEGSVPNNKGSIPIDLVRQIVGKRLSEIPDESAPSQPESKENLSRLLPVERERVARIDSRLSEIEAQLPTRTGPVQASLQREADKLRDERNGIVAKTEPAKTAKTPNQSRLKPFDDTRLSENVDTLKAMADNAGWAQEGGRLIIDSTGKKSRTTWIPKADWYLEIPKDSRLNAVDTVAAVQKAINGEPMGAKERRSVSAMLDHIDNIGSNERPVDTGSDYETSPADDPEAIIERQAIIEADNLAPDLEDDDIDLLLEALFNGSTGTSITETDLDAIFGPEIQAGAVSPSDEEAQRTGKAGSGTQGSGKTGKAEAEQRRDGEPEIERGSEESDKTRKQASGGISAEAQAAADKFKANPQAIINDLTSRGKIKALYEAANVMAAAGFKDLPMADKVAAYVKMVTGETIPGAPKPKGKPVETDLFVNSDAEQQALDTQQAIADIAAAKDAKRKGDGKEPPALFSDNADMAGQVDIADIPAQSEEQILIAKKESIAQAIAEEVIKQQNLADKAWREGKKAPKQSDRVKLAATFGITSEGWGPFDMAFGHGVNVMTKARLGMDGSRANAADIAKAVIDYIDSIKQPSNTQATNGAELTENSESQSNNDQAFGAKWDAMDYGQRQSIAQASDLGGMRAVVHRLSGSKWKEVSPGERKSMIAGEKALSDKGVGGKRPVSKDAPGTHINGDMEREQADRLTLVAKQVRDQNRIDRNTKEGNAIRTLETVADELRNKKTIISYIPMLEKASSDLYGQFTPVSELIDQIVEILQGGGNTEEVPGKSTGEFDQAELDAERFKDNKIFTADKVAAARERLKAKLGTLNSGFDPELALDGMVLAGAYIEAGAKSFADYTKAMVADLGEGVRPYLRSFYESVRAYPGMDKKDMTSHAELEAADRWGVHHGEMWSFDGKPAREVSYVTEHSIGFKTRDDAGKMDISIGNFSQYKNTRWQRVEDSGKEKSPFQNEESSARKFVVTDGKQSGWMMVTTETGKQVARFKVFDGRAKSIEQYHDNKETVDAVVKAINDYIASIPAPVIGQSPKVEKQKFDPLGNLKLKADWGVEHIDGYDSERDDGKGGKIKTEFLNNTKKYLNQVADLLTKDGFSPYTDKKGKAEKPVVANEGGPAGSGDVYLAMQKGNSAIYIQVGVSTVSAGGKSHPQGVAIMARYASNPVVKDKSANRGTNNWLPWDISTAELAKWAATQVGRMEDNAKFEEEHTSSKVIKTIPIAEDNLEINIARINGGREFSVSIKDNDSGLTMDGMRIFNTVDKAEKYAQELFEKSTPKSGKEESPFQKPELSEKEATSARIKLADALAEILISEAGFTSKQLTDAADKAFGGTQAQGRYTAKDAYDAMEAAVNLYLMNTEKADWSQQNARWAANKAKELNNLIQALPTQTKRDEEMDEFQQFSTPPALSFVANWVANVTDQDTMMEPSAGTGDLAVWADIAGAKLILNELSARRIELLRPLFPGARIFNENAEQLNNILPKDAIPTVVVMNPPFSSTAGRIKGQRDTMNGAKHLEQALARLPDGGRLVAIVGNGMADGKPAFKKWWSNIGKKYNVRANIGISGKEYAKYGTTFDNQILVIDKTGATTQPILTGQVESVAELPKLLEGIKNDRTRPTQQAASQSAGSNNTSTQQGNIQPADGTRNNGTSQDSGGTQPTGRLPGDTSAGAANNGTQSQAGKGNEPADGNGGRGQSDTGAATGKPGGSSQLDTAGNSTGNSSTGSVTVESVNNQADFTDSIFSNYQPQRLSIPGAKPHPGNLVQSSAMAAVEPPAPTYRPSLPKSVIEDGKLSIAQLETVVYAGQAHSEMLPGEKFRRGFFVGDGTGVGKGREISGIILDNLQQGRDKAIWVSFNKGLMKDAKRDFEGVGGDPALIFAPGSAKDELKRDKGILFVPYTTLRGGEKKKATDLGQEAGKSRVQQIIDWLGPDFDGVIAFDEAHSMGNAIAMKGKRGNKKPSAQALAGIELQNALPNARVVYVSATGATEISNLTYANRLGLWGEGTPFANPSAFINNMSQGGIAAMELISRDMKAMGMYIARSLSYDGVTYERLEHELTDLQEDIYNELAGAWQIVLNNITEALEATNQGSNGDAKGATMSRFWGAQLRFFGQIITTMSMPSVLESINKQLNDGNAVLIQLVNTNEAAQERMVADAVANEIELEDLDFTPREMLMDYIRTGFPVQQFIEGTDDNGNIISVPATDSNGNPVFNAEAVAMRDKLIETLKQIRVPGNPLDEIINTFGSANVAEVTGRGRRFVQTRDKEGNLKVVEEKLGKTSSEKDAEAFQDDKKQILVFSGAGGTGFSFHADNTAKNRRKRIHYILQAGWRADSAVQGFGRSHRTNQAQPPHYILPVLNMKAQKRFISTVARRLDQLGALTKGSRDANTQGMFGASDNLESEYASTGLDNFFQDLAAGRIPGLDFEETTGQMGLNLKDKDTGQFSRNKVPTIPQFLNRMLSLKTDIQNKVFDAFEQRMIEAIEYAKQRGFYDDGMKTLTAKSIVKTRDDVAYTDKKTGTITRYVEVDAVNDIDYRSWSDVKAMKQELEDRKEFSGFYEVLQGRRKGQVFMMRNRGTRIDSEGKTTHRGTIYGIVDGSASYIDDAEVIERGWDYKTHQGRYQKMDLYKKLSDAEAKALWESNVEVAPKTRTVKGRMLVGVILPIWDRVVGSATIYRMMTDDGEQLLGRFLDSDDAAKTLKNLGLDSGVSKLSADAIIARIKAGATAILGNGYAIKKAMVNYEPRLEVIPKGWFSEADKSIFKNQGGFVERIQFQDRFFLPIDSIEAFKRFTDSRPVVELLGGKSVDVETPKARYSNEYQKDLFGDSLPEKTGEINQQPANKRNVVATKKLRTQDESIGRFSTRTAVVSETTKLIGVEKIETPRDAAAAIVDLGVSAVERFYAIVTDKDNKPLAVVGSFKGTIDGASVYPAVITGEAFRIKGAANLWLVHNHPSGKPDLSNADRNITQKIQAAFDGTNIKVNGILATTPKGFYTYENPNPSSDDYDSGRVARLDPVMKIPVVDRVIVADEKLGMDITNPDKAKRIAAQVANGETGIVLLDNQNYPVGFVAISPEQMAKVKNTGMMEAIYRALSVSNTASAIIFDPSGEVKSPQYQNIGAFLKGIDINVLDAIVGDTAAAEMGFPLWSGSFLSKGNKSTISQGIPVNNLQKLVDKVAGEYKGLPTVRVLESIDQAPKALQDIVAAQGASETVEGAMHNGEIYLFANNLANIDRAEFVLAEHELTHIGLRGVLGDGLNREMNKIYRDNAKVRKLATQYQKQSPVSDAVATEEVLADMTADELAGLKGWRGIVQKMADWFRSHGFSRVADMLTSNETKAQLYAAELVKAARDYVKTNSRDDSWDTRLSTTEATTLNVLHEITKDDDVFRHPVSGKKDLLGIMGEVFPKATYAYDNFGAGKKITVFDTPTGRRFWVFEENGKIWIDVSNLKQGGYGSAIYAAVGNYAHNSGQQFIGDPSGLSADAVLRRTNAMLSLALKFKSTDFLGSSPEQAKGDTSKGVKPLQWGESYEQNILNLIDTIVSTVEKNVPAIRSTRYDFNTGHYTSDFGRIREGSWLDGIAASEAARNIRAGESTLRRAIVLKSIASSSPSEKSKILRKLETVDGLARSGLDSLLSRGNMPTTTQTPLPEGQTTITVDGVERSTLNSNGQAIHPTVEGVENFWRWFGDSKVVDESGRPLVVYHGTNADFYEFKSGIESAGHTIGAGKSKAHFFTDDPSTASGWALAAAPRQNNGPIKAKDGDYWKSGKTVYPVYLKIESAIEFDAKGNSYDKIPMSKSPYSLVEKAAKQKKDGVIIKNMNDSPVPGWGGNWRSTQYAVISSTNIKSAISNTGEFNPSNPDIRLSRGNLTSNTPGVIGSLRAKLQDLTSPETIDKLIYEFQDKYIDLKRLRDHIKNIGGTVSDLNDAYEGETRYHGRLAKRTKDFLNDELKPLLAGLRNNNISIEEFERFLHARHAPEANAEMAKRNPSRDEIDTEQQRTKDAVIDLQGKLLLARKNGSATKSLNDALEVAQQEKAKWQGTQAFKGTEQERLSLSGMSDAEASMVINNLSPGKRIQMEALAIQVDAITTKTLDELERYGLQSRESLDAWRSSYKHYIPLHRDEAHPDSNSHPIGQGFSTKGDASRSRVGSNAKVTHILGHIAMQRESALTRGEKNSVMKRLYLMARQNPLPDYWKTDKVPTIKVLDKHGFARTTVDPLFKQRPNVLMLRIAGKDTAIVFNENNPGAARLAQAMKNLDVDDLHYIIPFIGKGTRWLASVNTQYNPIFGVINLMRDVQTGALNLSTTRMAGHQSEVMAHTMTILNEVLKNNGRMPKSGPWARLYNEFETVGGTTGYRDLFLNPEDRSKELLKEIESLDRGKISKAAHAITDWLSDYNEAMENSVRLAAYKTGRDNGMTKERAAVMAKNLTVNFNRKGRQTRELGALYAFFNAALQGTTRMNETLSGPAGKKIMTGGIMLGAINAMVGMAMMGGGDDDNWEKIPEFIKERSIIIPISGEDYLTIPMPLGFNFLPNIGRIAVEVAADGGKDMGKRMASLAGVIADAFNPMGSSSSFSQMLTPTVLDPVVSLWENKDWTGKKIYREDFSNLDPSPGFKRSKATATPWGKGAAWFANAATGGTDYAPGALSPTPDQIDFVIGQLTGGIGREVSKTAEVLASPFSNEELPAYKIPLAGRLYGNTRGQAGQSDQYYENLLKSNIAENEIKGRIKEGKSIDDFEKQNPNAMDMMIEGNVAEKVIGKLKDKRLMMIQEGVSKSLVKEVNQEITDEMKAFNKKMREFK